jgi:cellulose 1,4-beta-cellobiosidase
MKFTYLSFLFLSLVNGNPFEPIHDIYINPDLVQNVEKTQQLIDQHLKMNKPYFDINVSQLKEARHNMEIIKDTPSAFWIDKRSKIPKVEEMLEDILSSNTYKSIVLIVYDLPNRDCAALASNGEICCNQSEECQDTCTQSCQFKSTSCDIGIEEYKSEYIDELFHLLNQDKYKSIQKILIIEPDSLPNIPTNRGYYGCIDITTDHYLLGIQYTLRKLSSIENVHFYLDIGHEGWLGWCNNLFENDYNFIQFVLKTLENEIPYIRGFATNVANYQNMGTPCDYPFQKVSSIEDFCSYYNQYLVGYCKTNSNQKCCYDPCGMLEMYNPANNELNYVQLFRHAIEYAIDKNIIPKFKTDSGLPHFIIDTSRNGPKNAYIETNGKSECSTWCNIKGGRIGILPTIQTEFPYIDAYFWLKTPGESDGCINFTNQGKCHSLQTSCQRYDANCGTHIDNIGYLSTEPCPPEAGAWFDYQFIRLNL